MDNFALFDDRNDALLLFNKINSPICILLNLFAIYLIVFKSSSEMGEYRWYLLHYQQIYLLAMWGLMASVCLLHSQNNVAIYELVKFKVTYTYSIIFKQSAEAMELLKIQNFFYQPASLSYGMAFSIGILSICISALIIMGLSCHMQYIFRKQCVHLTVHTQELQKKFLKAQIIQGHLTIRCIRRTFCQKALKQCKMNEPQTI
uniref:Serpentine receptor class gamma n=1 Tax=Heterorhabditis bacteriophora TaxID=37862 RepID=A0A1I7WZS8_HETBA